MLAIKIFVPIHISCFFEAACPMVGATSKSNALSHHLKGVLCRLPFHDPSKKEKQLWKRATPCCCRGVRLRPQGLQSYCKMSCANKSALTHENKTRAEKNEFSK